METGVKAMFSSKIILQTFNFFITSKLFYTHKLPTFLSHHSNFNQTQKLEIKDVEVPPSMHEQRPGSVLNFFFKLSTFLSYRNFSTQNGFV
jgi:hypothetical protein